MSCFVCDLGVIFVGDVLAPVLRLAGQKKQNGSTCLISNVQIL